MNLELICGSLGSFNGKDKHDKLYISISYDVFAIGLSRIALRAAFVYTALPSFD